MARGSQELSIGIKGDASGLTRATNQAAKALADLKSDVDRLDSDAATIKIDTNAEDVTGQLDQVKANVDALDAETVEVSAALELNRINRDIATLNKVLDGIERRKATADADMDITQLLRDEAKVRKALDNLELRKVEVEIEADTEGFASDLSEIDGLLGNIVPGLGRFSGALGAGGVAGAAVAAVGGVGALAFGLGQMAADVETSMVQLEALTGSADDAAQVFDDLQTYAAQTPFAFDEVTQSAKRLIAAGVGLEDLPDTLGAIGDVAAATGSPLEEVATVFAQIEGKGRLMNEELLQLTERGIPAYTLLADAMGLTRGEVEQMATAGELTREEIDLLYDAIDKTFGGTTQELADTFNGKVSTLKDTFTQTAQTVGTVFLPVMSDVVDTLQEVAGIVDETAASLEGSDEELGVVGQGWQAFTDQIGEAFDAVLLWPKRLNQELYPELYATGEAADIAGQRYTAMADAFEEGTPYAYAAADGAEAMAGSTSDLADSAGDAAQEIQNLLDQIDIINGRFLSFEESSIRVQDSFQSLRDDVEEYGKVQYDANGALKLADEGTREVYGSVLNYADSLGTNIEALIQQGASTRDVVAATRDARRDFIEAAVAAGIEEEAAGDLANQLGLVPGEVKTQHSQIGLAAAITDTQTLDQWLDNIDGRFTQSEHTHRNRIINLYSSVSNPGSGVIVEPGYGDQSRSAEAAALMAARLLGRDGGDIMSSYPSSPYYSGSIWQGPGPWQQSPSREITEVKPKREQIKIFLDGAEIASGLDLSATAAAVAATSNRRA